MGEKDDATLLQRDVTTVFTLITLNPRPNTFGKQMKGARFPCIFCNSHETSLGLHSVQREFRVKAADYGEGPSLM